MRPSLASIMLWLYLSPLTAQEPPQASRFENDSLTIRLVPRTPNQMAAFYEARGFARNALEVLKKACFVTVVIRNKTDSEVIWLEPKNWRFLSEHGDVARLTREYWNTQWGELKLPLAHRSTFGWTLLPERRDLQPKEPVGGNLALTRTSAPVTVVAQFMTGQAKQGPEITVRFENIRCAQD